MGEGPGMFPLGPLLLFASKQQRALPAKETVVVGSFPHCGGGALSPDGDVGLDALDNGHVKMAEVLHLVLHLTAGVAFALTLLLTEAPRLALLAHLLLAAQLRERRLLLASQG